MGRVHTIVDGCSFKTWPDIRQGAVESFLGGLSVKLTTHNGYITAFKHFCTWVVRDGRAEFSPVQYLDRVRVPDREKRRPLGFDEVCRLLRVTVSGPERYSMSGLQRAVLYRLAIETGFRRNELAHLTAGCFDLGKATVKLDAAFCKDRRDAQQPISMALAAALAGFLAGKDPTDPVFALRTPRTALMIQTDAVEAGLPLMDDEGRELVFHSLRHTLRTELVRARVSEAVIDHIMRHKAVGVGRRFYTHLTDFEIREAIERLPDYPWPGDLQQQAKKAVS
jgi:integrase